VTVTYEERLLGSAGTLRANRDWIGSDDDFWIFYGDVLTNVRLELMLDFHRRQRSMATLGVYKVGNPRQCGIVSVDDEHIIRGFVEKPAEPRGNVAFSGVMIASPAILDGIPDQVPVDLGSHVFPKLLGKISAYPISEYLVDIGTPTAYQQAQLSWPGLEAAA
jgi:mannose-1-phosphate guanylyltransferase